MSRLSGTVVSSRRAPDGAGIHARISDAAASTDIDLEVVALADVEAERWADPTTFVDLVIATDATALLAVRAEIAFYNPGCAFVLVIDGTTLLPGGPDQTTRRAMREADLIVAIGSPMDGRRTVSLHAPITHVTTIDAVDWAVTAHHALSRRRAAIRLLERQPVGERITPDGAVPIEARQG